MPNLIKVLVLVMPLMGCLINAQIAEEKGIGELKYDGIFNISTSDKQEAIKKAKVNALQRYIAKFDASKQSEYAKVSSKVESDLDTFVPDAMVVDENKDKKAKTYTVIVRASINAGLIDEEIRKISAISNVSSDQKSAFTFIFVSRKATNVKKHDNVVVQDVEVKERLQKEEDINEEQAVVGGSVSISSEQDSLKVARAKTTTQGSTEVISDAITYAVASSDDINTTITQSFGNAGYEVIESQMTGIEIDGQDMASAFIDDFSNGDDVSAKKRLSAAKSCKELEIKYLATGKLDIGENMKNASSGLVEVFVNVNAKVYDVSSKFPKVVSSVGPVQYSGVGPTQPVAERNALKLAGEKAAESLVSQMRSKNLY